MKVQFTSAFTLLLLNASASSFGAHSPKSIHRESSRSWSSTGLTFVSGGAVGNTFGTAKLKASVESDATCTNTAISLENLELLSERGKNAILSLIQHDVDGAQEHVYGDWPEAGVEDEGKKLLAEQVR
jgi:UDP-sugar pyrophosphorylase